ncbi:MAG: 4-hydroxy-3-methylbut-2-enyl diphosphate reductase [Candidatus Cloacimonadaceae bacterium]|jgi:(E)-4-hydroxy-3-methyl-but-2-enyl pyrophosphate reductase|nr:4-hydroxy-3-methylbut-2-enyl diphosphate reductase [Candidatus Cloacimonadota bacterium]MDY0127956.1 4-hydroxy-3-methylbut-2-enyl diphosphate reductase [Candidatus Cloacimonadaceae bacterium]MCB5254124.1 4-hydroxy-3-methylbut-2-enyl diphosphate reductase [Candidatus Cloacimonadota bacterium]MCK9178578.1 4-hydroxy-3-methylbut-2-enyl diphosphate reductase [Candidatus Cloacimonadota bacterium]MCK9242399.1 4-hydroxy-3-methylbut-2-enyl diphosphate reductase [Candidatus Cloacimonadota bacterium]
MILRLAASSGFCFGVRRAIQMALDASKGRDVIYSIGELIHNPQFVKELEEQGIKVAKEAQDIYDSVVIIRSHGITFQDLQILQANGNIIIDATCPYVSRTHELIQIAIQDGYEVLILGDAKHPEVIGMMSYGNHHTRIIAPGEVPSGIKGKRICLISQTTQKIENLKKLACDILTQVLELKVYNSICLATTQRQNASAALAKDSDLMIVIGGRKSSNTKMLASLCSQYCTTLHIETEEELTADSLLGKERIGLSAGASTPEDRILKVYNKILKINGEEGLATSVHNIPLFKEESC